MLGRRRTRSRAAQQHSTHTVQRWRLGALPPLIGLLLLMAVVGLSIQPPGVAKAAAPPGSGFTVTPGDLAFILKQIKIAERHAITQTASNPCGTLVNQVGDGIPDAEQVPDRLTSYGLRTVDGSCNNLSAGRETWSASDQRFLRLPGAGRVFGDAETAPAGFPPSGKYS